MAFDLDAIKKHKAESDKFLNLETAIQTIIDDERFEDELQQLMEYDIDEGNDKSYVYLRFSKTDRSNIEVRLTSSNCMILDYVLSKNVAQDNIINAAEGARLLHEKIRRLGLSVLYKSDSDLGPQINFENTIEHQTYLITIAIYLTFGGE